MHILELPSFFTPYGGEFCFDQSKALQEYGHEVRILSLVQISIKKSIWKYFTYPYYTFKKYVDGIHIIKRYSRGIPKIIRKNQQNWVSVVMNMFVKYIKQYGKPDIIHAHCAKWAGYAAMLISKKYNIPYVITEHLSSGILKPEFDKCGGLNAWQIPMLRETYYNADMVIPVSEELVLDLKPYFGNSYKHQVISNTIDTNFFSYKKRPSIINNAFVFCCIAHFEHLKGYDILLPAFDKLCNIYPNCKLHIAGRNTDSAEFQAIIQGLKHSQNIEIHGLLNKTKVREILYQSNALVLASRSEAQSLVLLEAICTGIPIITTPSIAESQKIENSYTIIPFNDINALSNAMQNLIKKPIDCYNASNYIKKHYSFEQIAITLTQTFSNIINERNTL